MKSRASLLLTVVVMVGGVILGSACGGGSNGSTTSATASPSVAATPEAAGEVSSETLQNMVPGAEGLPGFVLTDARFLDNEGASARAPDPAARQASLDEMGRVVGFHAIFSQGEDAPPDAPSAILWSVNLFKQPSGALEFVSQPPEVPEGLTYESMDVSTLGSNAVGFAFAGSAAEGTNSAYSVAFAEGVVEVSLTTVYEEAEPAPDYTLNLAQQARTLVESGLQGGSATPSPSRGEEPVVTPTASTEAPGSITVPTRAEIGTP